MRHIFPEMKLERYQEKLPMWKSGGLSKALFAMKEAHGVIAWFVAFP